MDASLGLILVLAFAFAMTHVERRLVGERVRLFQGLEYLILGFLVGPVVLGFLDSHRIGELEPLGAILTGFVGFLAGLGVDLRRRPGAAIGARRFGLVLVVLTAGAVGVGAYAALGVLPGLGDDRSIGRLIAAATLGLGAAVSSTEAILGGVAATRSKGPVSRLMPQVATATRFAVIVLFGVLVASEHQEHFAAEVTVPGWNAVSVGTGLVVGLIFHVFVGHEDDTEKLFVATIGGVMLASGIAYALDFSALFVNLIAGLVVANLSPSAPRLAGAVARLDRPFTATLLLLAGATWTPIPAVAWLLPLLYVPARVVALHAAAWLSSRRHPSIDPHTPWLGNALLSQGPLAVALAVEYQLIPTHDFVGAVETCLLLSAVASEVWAPWALRRVLQNAGETGRRPREDEVGDGPAAVAPTLAEDAG